MLPPIRLRSSRTSFSAFCNLVSRCVTFSAMFATVFPNAPRLWVTQLREQVSKQPVDPEHWSTLSLFSLTCALHRQQLNARNRTAAFFILAVDKSLLLWSRPLPSLPLLYFIWHFRKHPFIDVLVEKAGKAQEFKTRKWNVFYQPEEQQVQRDLTRFTSWYWQGKLSQTRHSVIC